MQLRFWRDSKPETTTEAVAETRSLTDDLLSIFGLGGVSVAGPAVNATTAQRCPAVRNAVLVISEAVGMLPIHTYRREGAARSRDREHPVHTLLHDQANEWTAASDFREQMTRDALLHDQGGLAFINRAGGRIVELLRFEPGAVTVEKDQNTGEPVYRQSDRNGGRIIPREDIFHIRPPGGRAPISDGKEAIALALALEGYASRLFSNGARPSGLISFPGPMSPDGLAKARAAWQAIHSGQNAGGTAALDHGAKFEALAFKSTDAQFQEMRLFSVNEIGRVFKINPIFLQELGRATWSNSAEMGRNLLVYTLNPYLVRWESEIALKLFTPEERETYFAEFERAAITQADLKTRMESYGAAISNRIMSPNEVRARENLPPYEGGDRFENPNTTAGGGANE